MLGELGLDGSVRPVPGVLALVDALRADGDGLGDRARDRRRRGLARARDGGSPGTLGRGAARVPEGRSRMAGAAAGPALASAAPDLDDEPVDLADVRGLPRARRALEVAAAGGHHLLLTGPPGTGKTMLARRLPTILPPLDADEALEVTRIHSAAGHAPRHGLARRASLPGAAPHGVDGRPRRRRLEPPPPRRGDAGPSRRRCSSTSWASSHRTRSTRCASRSRSTWSASRGRRCRSCSLPTSCSSRARTRVRAVGAGRAANAPRRNAPATGADCRRRCSTASTCASKCTHPSRATGPVSRPPRSATASPRPSPASGALRRRPWRRNARVPAGALAQADPAVARTPTRRGAGRSGTTR